MEPSKVNNVSSGVPVAKPIKFYSFEQQGDNYVYKVRAGDTLSEILKGAAASSQQIKTMAQTGQLTSRILAECNGIKNPNLIKTNQKILIPTSPKALEDKTTGPFHLEQKIFRGIEIPKITSDTLPMQLEVKTPRIKKEVHKITTDNVYLLGEKLKKSQSLEEISAVIDRMVELANKSQIDRKMVVNELYEFLKKNSQGRNTLGIYKQLQAASVLAGIYDKYAKEVGANANKMKSSIIEIFKHIHKDDKYSLQVQQDVRIYLVEMGLLPKEEIRD